LIIKILLFLICSLSGFFIAYLGFSDASFVYIISSIGFVIGASLSFFVIFLEKELRKLPAPRIVGGVLGLMLGLLISLMIAFGLNLASGFRNFQPVLPWLYLFIVGIFGYLGILLGYKKAEEINFPGKEEIAHQDYRILDTSVIIEGRIADICDTGFIEGTLIVPRFVLNELQLIADSSDSMKRLRGRRGLDILNHLQKSPYVNIEIMDYDFPKFKGVDAKLVALAKQLNGKLITNDYNLNKVAELQGIRVLNINELANAMKPVVLPGEQMTVKIIREGKEPGQGVAYLDDGTMIVVDNGQKLINQNVKVTVTSVLQTTAGRMIFSEVKEVVS